MCLKHDEHDFSQSRVQTQSPLRFVLERMDRQSQMLDGAGIFPNLCPRDQPHVGKYSSTMEHLEMGHSSRTSRCVDQNSVPRQK